MPKANDPEVLAKEAEVVKLRRGGLTWDLIAERVGYSHAASAQKAFERSLARVVADDVRAIRQLEYERLDLAQAAIWQKVLNADISAVTALIRIMERRAKLLGLDVPIKAQIDVTVREDVVREIERLAAELGVTDPNIIDAEEIDDGDPAE
jgi:hypothetical protein